MFKTYMRLLGFARPIKKYAIPYFFYSLFYALFNSLTFMLIIPILNTMFDANYSFEYVEKLPPLELNQDYLATLFNFAYSHIFEQYDRQNVLMLLAVVAICISPDEQPVPLPRRMDHGEHAHHGPCNACATKCSRA